MTQHLSAEISERDITLDDKVEEERTQIITNMKSKFEDEKSQMNEEIKNLKSKQVELQSEANKLNRTISELTAENDKLKSEITNQQKEFDTYKSTTEERFDKEKNEMKNHYDATIKALGQRCSELSEDIANFAEELTQSEVKYNKLQKEKQTLIEDKRKLNEEKKRIQSSVEREKMLAEALAKTKIIEEQASSNEKLLLQKMKFEDEKKKLMNYFADKFRNFFSPMKPIDDHEYRFGVEKAFDEYKKLLAADEKIRKLLNAKQGQTTPDAVAQIIVNNDIKLQ